jgi:hypothetical protein
MLAALVHAGCFDACWLPPRSPFRGDGSRNCIFGAVARERDAMPLMSMPTAAETASYVRDLSTSGTSTGKSCSKSKKSTSWRACATAKSNLWITRRSLTLLRPVAVAPHIALITPPTVLICTLVALSHGPICSSHGSYTCLSFQLLIIAFGSLQIAEKALRWDS